MKQHKCVIYFGMIDFDLFKIDVFTFSKYETMLQYLGWNGIAKIDSSNYDTTGESTIYTCDRSIAINIQLKASGNMLALTDWDEAPLDHVLFDDQTYNTFGEVRAKIIKLCEEIYEKAKTT